MAVLQVVDGRGVARPRWVSLSIPEESWVVPGLRLDSHGAARPFELSTGAWLDER